MADVTDKTIGKPFTWNADKDRWDEWSIKVKAVVGSVDLNLKAAMDAASIHPTVIANADLGSDGARQLNAKLYFILTGCTEKSACDWVRNTE